MPMKIYLDNAATSWPKPECMIRGIINFNSKIGSNPGRSGHSMSVEAGRILFNARDLVAGLFAVDDPMTVVFTPGMTYSLNLVIRGLLKKGDHVITTSMEHNSVMRPLRYLEEQGVEVTAVQCDGTGMLDPDDIQSSIRSNTSLIITTHASNVTGTLMPVAEVGRIAGEHGILFCVDSAQTAGSIEIDVNKMNIDLLCFSGHKGLLGPTGTGGIYIKKGVEKKLEPLIQGGTGSRSEYEMQPDFMPDKYESGTLNIMGIAGFLNSLEYIKEISVREIHSKEMELTSQLVDGLRDIPGVKIYGAMNPLYRTAVVSFNIEGTDPSESALILDEKYGILSRPGLHCAPSAHKTAGSFPCGTNRLSPGLFNTHDEIETAIKAVWDIATKRGCIS